MVEVVQQVIRFLLDTGNREETPGRARTQRDVLSHQGTTQDPPGGAGRRLCGKGRDLHHRLTIGLGLDVSAHEDKTEPHVQSDRSTPRDERPAAGAQNGLLGKHKRIKLMGSGQREKPQDPNDCSSAEEFGFHLQIPCVSTDSEPISCNKEVRVRQL
ncbi:unnamed protein product [Pleuronectes platessa]|uniref:Uncharacterized protein n=1 Tax=Pleuronectes platessa TaxID=8262 RepID=A0A9N7VT84_PLEPL|nr:unnamed protein product [Pleuronectes platessa]